MKMTTPPVVPPAANPEVTSDDRVWVILCFLITPLIPLITLFIDEKKNRPFIKYHTIPTLVLGIAEWVAIAILSLIPVIGLVGGLLWIINIYYAIKANSGNNVEIPVISDFVKKQGW
jgi:uncharacterized protein